MSRATGLIFAGAVAFASPAWAQTAATGIGTAETTVTVTAPAPIITTHTTGPNWSPGPQTPRILFDVGAVLIGSANAGTATATYIAPDGTSIPQFSLEKSIGPAVGVNGHLSFRITERVRLEAAARWARAEFRTKLSGDTDGADDATATQSVDRFVVGGGGTIALKQFGRWHTFGRGSFGWLRELSDDQSLYKDGWTAEVGGGANFQWKEMKGHFRPYGIRTDIWLDVRHGGLPFSEKPRVLAPAFSVAMIFKL